ncbi:MAG: exosortase/archaeosortase family protein, partial [Verrucomicrobiaceae bacterium]
ANTQTAQALSTDGAYRLLQVLGLHPKRVDPSVISLDRFTLNVGISCSGMKTLIAVAAISYFFILVAGLKPWKNALLLLLVLPTALIVNALRIALIGLVGNTWGAAVGHQFHDYSGYLSLALCFGLQYGVTRLLGWK